MLEFAFYRFARRVLPEEDYDILQNSFLLTKQYICDNFIKGNKSNLRRDSYEVLRDALNIDDDARIGREVVILPASFHGSPRYMIQAFQDAMTVVAKKRPPDYFITMSRCG